MNVYAIDPIARSDVSVMEFLKFASKVSLKMERFPSKGE